MRLFSPLGGKQTRKPRLSGAAFACWNEDTSAIQYLKGKCHGFEIDDLARFALPDAEFLWQLASKLWVSRSVPIIPFW